MIIDEKGLFPRIKESLLEVFPNSRFFVKGSRLGNKIGNKYDFDIIIEIPGLTRESYLLSIDKFYRESEVIKEYYKEVIDEFGNPVKIDLFFTQDSSNIERYREI